MDHEAGMVAFGLLQVGAYEVQPKRRGSAGL